MRRTNTFAVRPRSEEDDRLLREALDASASLRNALNYKRRQNFFEGESVWDTADHRKRYVGVLGSATAQQVRDIQEETLDIAAGEVDTCESIHTPTAGRFSNFGQVIKYYRTYI